jgi:hypothetical protein
MVCMIVSFSGCVQPIIHPIPCCYLPAATIRRQLQERLAALLMFPCPTGSQAYSSQGREGRIHTFAHGLDGDVRTTWDPQDNPTHFWPAWLGDDCPPLRVWVPGLCGVCLGLAWAQQNAVCIFYLQRSEVEDRLCKPVSLYETKCPLRIGMVSLRLAPGKEGLGRGLPGHAREAQQF